MTTPFPCRIAASPGSLELSDEGFSVAGEGATWLDVDDVLNRPHGLAFVLADGSTIEISHLGQRFDECAQTVRELRGAARRPALTQSALPALAAFEARQVSADGSLASVSDVILFPHALVIEPRGGRTTHVPLPLVTAIARSGWTFTLHLRGLGDVRVGGFGQRTDEFAQRVQASIDALQEATSQAYAERDPVLVDVEAPDGWAITKEEAGQHWPALASSWLAGERGSAIAHLLDAGVLSDLRLGMWTEGGSVRLPFVLATRDGSSRWLVEAVDADDRATFIFDTDEVDRLNAALILTAFRREAVSLPESDLGRWAVAVRTEPVVRWLRAALTTRVTHGPGWLDEVEAALATR